jgi:quercetin dioxygenase-like cupin family protein
VASDRPGPRRRKLGDPRPVPNRPGQASRTLVGPEDGARELFVEEIRFEAGAEIPLHHHPIMEAFVVLEGALTVRLGEDLAQVQAEQTVAIPPGTAHALANRGTVAARALAVAPWDHDTFFSAATTYLEGVPRG